MSDNDSEPVWDLSSPSQARLRPCHKETWKKNVAKAKRNKGQEYVSLATGKTVPERKVGPPCKCSKKCYDRVGYQNIKDIFHDYWNSG